MFSLTRNGIVVQRSGSVVECLTRDRGSAGSSLTGVIRIKSNKQNKTGIADVAKTFIVFIAGLSLFMRCAWDLIA